MSIFEDFKIYFENNKNIFCCWGDFVTKKLLQTLSEKIFPLKIHDFLKIEAKPRVKELNSAIVKISRKNYKNPIEEMTDLVGIRFVVLIAEQIKIISEIIDNEPIWKAVVSKDFEKEQSDNPNVFDYQSKHYEVYPKEPLKINFLGDEITIPKNICCEIQIRSLLQHAYAELVHDNLYKPNGQVPPEAKREVAKSMALMETTDDLFSNTLKILNKCNERNNNFYSNLSELFIKKIDHESLRFDKKTNLIILETYSDFISENSINEINNLLVKKQYIITKIKERINSYYLFQQPFILFIYFLVNLNDKNITITNWPLPGYIKQLDYIFSDLDKGYILHI